MRYSALGILLLGAALSLAWLQLSHLWFAIIAGIVLLLGTVVVVAWDGMRQTSPENLSSRGIVPEAVGGITMIDPGLRRQWVPVLPAQRTSGKRARHPSAPPAARVRRPSSPSPAMAVPPPRPGPPSRRAARAGCHHHPGG